MLRLILVTVGRSRPAQKKVEELVPCECGCGQSFPKSQMQVIETGYPEHPNELIYIPHALAIYAEQGY